MDAVNGRNQELGLPHMEMGIGLNTGEVVVGNIGSAERMKYGVVGSHVNLTSRIESYTVGGQILISAAVLEAAGPELLKVGGCQPIRAKGFKEPITVYELRGAAGKYDLHLPESVDDLRPIAESIPLRFTVLEGKHVSDVYHAGDLVQLSEASAEIRSKMVPQPLQNVKLVLESARPELAGDLYAKVIARPAREGEPPPPDDCFVVRFTSMPAGVESWLESVLQGNPPLTKDDDASGEHPIPAI